MDNVKTKFKQVLFLIILVIIAQFAIIIISNGKIKSLEGYLYSLVATATDSDATSCDATSSDAQKNDATSCNATSSDAQKNDATSCNATSSDSQKNDATSCNATSGDSQKNNATSCNATSSNAKNTSVPTSNKNQNVNQEVIKQQEHLKEIQQVVEEEKEEKLGETVLYKNTEINSSVISKIKDSEDIK